MLPIIGHMAIHVYLTPFAMRDKLSVAVVTNDIYTKEDADALVRMQALPSERIIGVETGGCPHTAIREDATINLQAIKQLTQTHFQ